MKRRQQFAETAPAGRSRGRGRSANGGLRGASRSPARTGGDTSGFDHSAKKTTKKRRNQTQSHTNTPFRPLDQNYSRRSAGEERSAAYMEDPTVRVGADILETLGKEERDICLLMVDMLSRQSHVTALRIIGSLQQRLDVKRYLDLYGGTYEHSVTPENVKDLDGRRELMEHLMAAQQALSEARRPEAEAREAARADFLSSNNPASRSGGAKPNQAGSKVIRKTPAPPRSPAKKEAPRSNLPPNLRHMSYSATDTAFSSENSPGVYSNASPMSNHPPPPVSVPVASMWSGQPSGGAAPPASSSPPPPAPAALPPKAPDTQAHLGNAYSSPVVPLPVATNNNNNNNHNNNNNNVAKYSTLGASQDEAPEEDWMHESPSVDNSPENVPPASKKEQDDDHFINGHVGQQLSWESPTTHERDEGVVVGHNDEESNDAHSVSHTDEDYYKKPGDEEDEEEEIDDIEDEEEEVVDQSDGEEDAGEDDKKKGDSAFPWDDI